MENKERDFSYRIGIGCEFFNKTLYIFNVNRKLECIRRYIFKVTENFQTYVSTINKWWCGDKERFSSTILQSGYSFFLICSQWLRNFFNVYLLAYFITKLLIKFLNKLFIRWSWQNERGKFSRRILLILLILTYIKKKMSVEIIVRKIENEKTCLFDNFKEWLLWSVLCFYES